MVLPSIATPEHAALVAGRVVRSVAEPVDIDGHEVTVGVSVGIALHPAHGADMDRLVHAADSAMYAAKREGKGRFVIATVDDGNGSMPVLRFVNWDDSALVGVGEIDEQHQRLVELINALGEDLKSIQPRERVQATLEELVRFTREHFEAEERLLEAYAPDQLERHRRSHRRLLEDLESLASGVDGQSMALTMRYLQDWLFAHIDAADRPLAQALNAHGIR
jgi:hemerythrin-like metal-binding protein